MKNFSIKVIHFLAIFLLSACVNSGDKSHEQKASGSRSNTQENLEVHMTHRSFLERINPINAFAPIFGGIITDIDNMRSELNKNNQTDKESRADNTYVKKNDDLEVQNVR